LSADDLARLFINNPYEKYNFIHNSSMNKRGVGVLIKSSISHDILDIRRSQDENILLLHARVKGTEIVIVSIYGPNSNDPGFFAALQDLLREFNNLPVIMGGGLELHLQYRTSSF
jgi:hypothetical protein